jgi:hypothetical protein
MHHCAACQSKQRGRFAAVVSATTLQRSDPVIDLYRQYSTVYDKTQHLCTHTIM